MEDKPKAFAHFLNMSDIPDINFQRSHKPDENTLQYRYKGKCPRCQHTDVTKQEVPGSHKWAYNFHCDICDLKYSVNYEDRMGSQDGDVVKLFHHYKPMT